MGMGVDEARRGKAALRVDGHASLEARLRADDHAVQDGNFAQFDFPGKDVDDPAVLHYEIRLRPPRRSVDLPPERFLFRHVRASPVGGRFRPDHFVSAASRIFPVCGFMGSSIS